MIFQETPLKGAFVVDIEKIEDERGFFAEGWKDEVAREYGIDVVFNRTNVSFNKNAGTLRGLHNQAVPFEEAKLVRCIQGRIYDVIVDVRTESETYLQWFGVELSAKNHRMLYIPRGFLHGFQTLMDDSTVYYQVSGVYTPQAEVGVRYNDPAFNIQWPMEGAFTMSPKDRQWPPFQPVMAPCC